MSPTEHSGGGVDISPVRIDPLVSSQDKEGEDTPRSPREHSGDKGYQAHPLLYADAV